MRGLIDFHSHILPGIDDGSKSLEMSIQMLRMEAQQGVERVIATPHFYPQYDTPERFLRRRGAAEITLREEMQKHTGLPALSVGAEVYYFPGISDSEVISELTIDQKRCILIEMPTSSWTEAMYRELEGIYVKRGLIPIVAHIDRYIGRFYNRGIPKRLAQLPVLIQANAEFFLEKYTSSMALRMLKKDGIHLLGSDCHDLSSRKPNLQGALELINRRVGRDAMEGILSYQQNVLAEE
jgi:protein-tyrosine phosphatase